MSNIDTRKAGGGQTVSYASVRLESETLLPEQLIDMLIGAARNSADPPPSTCTSKAAARGRRRGRTPSCGRVGWSDDTCAGQAAGTGLRVGHRAPAARRAPAATVRAGDRAIVLAPLADAGLLDPDPGSRGRCVSPTSTR